MENIIELSARYLVETKPYIEGIFEKLENLLMSKGDISKELENLEIDINVAECNIMSFQRLFEKRAAMFEIAGLHPQLYSLNENLKEVDHLLKITQELHKDILEIIKFNTK